MVFFYDGASSETIVTSKEVVYMKGNASRVKKALSSQGQGSTLMPGARDNAANNNACCVFDFLGMSIDLQMAC